MSKKSFIILSQSGKDCQPEAVTHSPQCGTCGSTEFVTTEQPAFAHLRNAKTQDARRKAKAKPKQLSLWESQQKLKIEYPLRIEPLPPALQWWDEERFWLVHIESGLRVPGMWSRDEAELIQDLSQQWDWRTDKDRRVVCGLQLLALAEAVCKRSFQKGGEL